jgi:hypothetical protein
MFTERNLMWALLGFSLLLAGSVAQCVRVDRARALAVARATKLEREALCAPAPTTREQLASRIEHDLAILREGGMEGKDAGNAFLGDYPPWYFGGPFFVIHFPLFG